MLALAITCTGPAYGQETSRGTITGTITDAETGRALPAVNVAIEGTTRGTSSDDDGRYTITEVNPGRYTILATFVGYAQGRAEGVVVEAGETTTVNFALQPGEIGLDEVVVTGYGTQRQRDLTGAISSISAREIQAQPVTSVEQTLQGRTAGVQVRQTGGNLEGDFRVFVRGVASTGETQPLYVLDGVPLFSGALSTISADDIESIDVLKDASAAAIYGARGSNGVVLITTKSGRSGRTRVDFVSEFGTEESDKRLDMVNSAQQAEIWRQAMINSGKQVEDNLDEAASTYDNDFQDLILRTGLRQQHTLSISGGSDATTFFVSGGFTDRRGTLINTDLRRLTARANLDHQATERFRFGARVTGSSQFGNRAVDDQFWEAPYRGALVMRPWVPHKDENGELIPLPPQRGAYKSFMFNPVAKAEADIHQVTDRRFLGNAYAEYDLGDHLRFRAGAGTDLLYAENYNYFPIFTLGGLYNRPTGQVRLVDREEVNWMTDQTLTYSNIFDDVHDLTALVGFTAQKFTRQAVEVVAEGTTNNQLRRLANQPEITRFGDDVTESGLVSYFGRLNYDYDNKYLITLTIRRDGSSRFGPDQRYGTFPSASIGWRVSSEPFMKGSTFLDDLKFRVSYGLTGNQNIGDFQFMARVQPGLYAFGDDLALANIPVSFSNPNLQWETVKQFDVGVDAILFNGRLTVTADYYDKISEDLLVSVPVASTNGIASVQTVNLGEVQNNGVELSLSTINVEGDRFSWNTDFNISRNWNEVLDIGKDVTGEDRVTYGPGFVPFNIGVNVTTAGQPIGAFRGYEFLGNWQLDEAEEAARYGQEPGDSKFRDVNNDGVINDDDFVILGQPQPKVFGGLSNTFSYGNLSLSLFLTWQTGHKIVNTLAMFTESGLETFRQTTRYYENYWREDRPSDTFGKPRSLNIDNQFPSSKNVEDGSFLRVQTLSLSYDLPVRFVSTLGARSARLSLIGTNLKTFTDYSGLNPEVSSFENPIASGLDYTAYPLTRAWTVRLNLGF